MLGRFLIIFFVIVSSLFAGWGNGWGGGNNGGGGGGSQTLVVDSNPETSSSWLGETETSCEDTEDFYDTIQDAVDNANDGDTIKICAGDYREKVTIEDIDDLNITSGADVDVPTDVNWTNDDIVLEMKGANNLHVENISLHMDNSSDSSRTIYLKSGGNFSATNLIVISDKGRAFYAKQNAENTLKKMTLHATKEAILIKSGKKQTFEDINISGGSDDGSGALYVQDANGTEVVLTNVDINVSVRAVLIKNAIPIISNSKIVTNGPHTTVKLYDDTNDTQISDSCFYSEDTDYALYIKNTEQNADVTDSCFYGAVEKLAYSKASETGFDQNYWDGLASDTYDYNNVVDSNPRSSCPNSCGGTTDDTPAADYRMDECSWDGTEDEVKDQTDNHYDGTAKNGATTESNTTVGGGLCQVGKFDGDDDYVYNDDIYEYLKTTASLSFWIKTTQTGDADDAWRSPGVVGIEESGGSDDIFWGWLDDKGHIGVSKGNNDDDSRSSTAVNDNQWHHVVLARDSSNGDVKIYIDGDLDTSGSTDSGDVGNSFSSIGRIENTDSSKELHYFQGYIDELKVYPKVLSSSEVSKIYSNENDGKNYDGSDRVCNDCNGGGSTTPIEGDYNGVDLVASECNANDNWDDNLTTKIVSKSFSLTILARDKNTSEPIEANITKTELQYYASGDNNACSGDMVSSFTVCENCGTTDSDGCLNIDNIQVDKAVKCVAVYIEGTETSTETDSNATATDDFAIRPERFVIDTPSSTLYAGEAFDVNVSAKVYNSDANATDYNETLNDSFSIDANETKSGCSTGSLSIDSFSMADGKKEDINTSYDEVGDINITIKEISGSEYAEVDSDDTNDTTRFIEANITTLHVSPYELNITSVDYTNSTAKEWLYTDANLSTNGVSISLHVGAYNKQGELLDDFNSTCYAQDINVTFYYDTNITTNASEDINLTLDGNLTSDDVSINDINKTLQISKDAFVSGEANASYSFGVDRNYSQPLSPIEVDLNEANITTADVAEYIHGKNGDENQTSTFYYGRVYTQDMTTSKKDDSSLVKILVYSQESNTYVDGLHEELVNWYFYTPHDSDTFGQVEESLVTDSITKTTEAFESDVAYDTQATYKVDVNNSEGKVGTYFIHLDISPWLWYTPEGFGSDYNSSDGSECGEHPCIKYNYETQSSGNSVSSGSFKGVDFDVNISKNSRGIRLLR